MPIVAPFADFLNHRSEPDLLWTESKNASGKNDMMVFATKDIRKGEQVFTSYGTFPNSQLLFMYGFIDPLS